MSIGTFDSLNHRLLCTGQIYVHSGHSIIQKSVARTIANIVPYKSYQICTHFLYQVQSIYKTNRIEDIHSDIFVVYCHLYISTHSLTRTQVKVKVTYK